jgi:alkylation response protein AidB-like acyl-CoA dehydrogenase
LNFEPSEDQLMIAESFARFFDENSSMARVRAAQPAGFDPGLWRGLAEMGAFAMRVPEEAGGLGLGLLDAALVMEEAGRTLASGPVAEAIVTARLLAALGAEDWLGRATAGDAVVTLALHDAAEAPRQWIAGGAAADAVIVREGNAIHLIAPSAEEREAGANLASTPIAEIALDRSDRMLLAQGAGAIADFERAIEEWKLLTAAGLAGLSREAIRLAAAYASERKAFGQPIGTFQAISHPLAELSVDTDGAKYFVWRAIRDIADGAADAAAEVSLALWWAARTAGLAGAQALHSFGGYGLTTEYDVHLYTLHAKALPLILGDPADLTVEAGRRLYGGETVALPAAGAVSIDFDIGDEARTLAAEVDAFFKANLTPELKARAHYSFDGHDPGLHQKIAEAGLLFPSWPPEYGGRNASPYAARAAAEMWETHNWTGHAVATTSMIGAIMQHFGSDELKREVLSRVVAGESICSLGFSEPGSGSDVFAAVTKAVPDGNGWRIDGQKMFTSGANIADYVLLLARTNPDVPKHKGLTMFIVPLKAEGVDIHPVFTFQDERTNITYYDGVRIPDSYRLGEVDGGVRVMAKSLELEHGGSGAVKTQRHMLHCAEEFCRATKRRGRAMIEDAAVQARLAKVAAHVALSELIRDRAAWVAVEKRADRAYGPSAKLFSTEKFRTDSADLLDLCAPESLSKRAGPAAFINQCYRHSQGTTIYAGTSEVHRSIIAERQLDLPRSRG